MIVAFEIWQIPHDCPQFRTFGFMDYEFCTENGFQFTTDNYEKVYNRVDETDLLDIYDYLESLFCEFNQHHPADYKGRSMSTSDIIVANGKPYFCDRDRFRKIESFD